MPRSCKCILDRAVFKGAMSEEDRDKILRNLKCIKWHKDSDETPNDTKKYLLFREDKSFCIGWYDCSHDGDLLWHEDGGWVIWDVIYWAELPMPYEEGAEE